jgi:hypothetical protein
VDGPETLFDVYRWTTRLMRREWVALDVSGFRRRFGVCVKGVRCWRLVVGLHHRLEWELRMELLVELVGVYGRWECYVQVLRVLDLVY